MVEILQLVRSEVQALPVEALFAFLFCFTFVSEDAACLLAGTAVAGGRISFGLAVTACFLGIVVGDVLLYSAGRAFGNRIFGSRLVSKLVSEDTRSKAKTWLESNGMNAVFVSRFVSGLRLPTYLLAGVLRAGFARFLFYFVLAAALWTPLLIGSTAFSQTLFFSNNWLLGVFAIAVIVRSVTKYSSHKARRLLVGRFKRAVTWEFWPLPIFYLPVVLYIAWLGIKHRSFTVFTAANPGVFSGGVKGESKDAIYKLLRAGDMDGEFSLRYLLLKAATEKGERLAQASRFVEVNRLSFPLVLKPDVGERGKGVVYVRTSSQLATEIASLQSDAILQEFAPGHEVSIFYMRHPDQDKGRIFSITEKRFPFVVGDGGSTVEDLILNDSRAVCLAEKYFEQNSGNLHLVPGRGEEVPLVEIGTHSRGAIFLDGERLKTEALERRIDKICRRCEGFYFGRFDIRTPRLEDLKRGENFKLIELNGVTSESTNIYDPKHGLFEAYKILFEQWRNAFSIGVANRDRGTKTTSMGDLAKLALGYEISGKKSRNPGFQDLVGGGAI